MLLSMEDFHTHTLDEPQLTVLKCLYLEENSRTYPPPQRNSEHQLWERRAILGKGVKGNNLNKMTSTCELHDLRKSEMLCLSLPC